MDVLLKSQYLGAVAVSGNKDRSAVRTAAACKRGRST